MFIDPTVQDFKNYFNRDFEYGETTATVMDSDICKAYKNVNAALNRSLADDQCQFTLFYLLLAAHFLVMNLRASSQGIAGSYSWLQTSKSVGSVSESFQIPQYILDNPLLSMYAKTTYGAQFLMYMIPKLTGTMFGTPRRTNP